MNERGQRTDSPSGAGEPAAAMSAGTSATEETFDADVIGVDVIGFSRFTQNLIDRKGAGAAEEVRDILDVGFRAVSDRLKISGFIAVDSLGDGILLARPRSSSGSSLAQLANAAEEAFSAALRSLRVRAAFASGRISLCRVGGLQQRWDVVATGAGIEALHAAMRRKRELEPIRSPDESGDATTPSIRAGGRDIRAISEIRRLAVAFVALAPPQEMLHAPLATLQAIASLGQSLAESCGGHLEKITHDDKGLLLDFAFARTREIGRTALDSALDFVLDLQPLLKQRGFTPRFGLSEGYVYRGALELGQRTISIVHGPAVNLCAKLAASGNAEISLDWPSAQNLVARFRDFTAGSERALPNGMRYVAFRLDDVLPRQAARKAEVASFTGRDAERALFVERFRRLEQGNGGLFFLSGAPGIGKTAVLQSLREFVRPPITAYWLHADPRRTAEYMSLWHDLAPHLIDNLPKPGPSEQLSATLTAAGIPPDLHAVLCDVAPNCTYTPSHRLAEIEGVARHEILERALLALVKTATQKSPVLLCLDDAHWYDEASMRLLAKALQAAAHLLVIISHREGRYGSLEELKQACSDVDRTSVALGPLPADAVHQIAASASPILAANPKVLDQVFNLSGGSPFHAEQLAHLLQDRISESVAALARDLAAEPKVIDHILNERLDGLTTVETQLVRTLSILDRPITTTATEALVLAPPHVTRDAIARLASNAFVGTTETGALVMKNRLLADAVVGRVPPRELRLLHRDAARFVATLRASKQDQTASDADLAHHWREAGEFRRAAVSFGKAGDEVLYAGAPELAVEFYERAVSALAEGAVPLSGRAAGWHAGSAVAFWAQGEMKEALDHASRALELIDAAIGGPHWLPRFARKAIARTRRIGLASSPLRKRAVPHALRAPLVTLSAIRAEMAFFLGDVGTVLGASASIGGFASAPRLRARARARANLFLGYTLAQAGMVNAAHRAWNAARAIGEAAEDPVASSHGYLGEAMWHMSFGRWSTAQELLAAARELYGDVADPAYHKFVETLLAFVSYFRGDWQACADRYTALRLVGERQRNLSTQTWGLYGAASALIIPGRFDEADAQLRKAEEIVHDMPDRQSQLICKGLRTQIEFGKGRHDRALESAMDCLALAKSLPANNFGSLEGFAAPAEILLRLSHGGQLGQADRAKVDATKAVAIKTLKRFARNHPIAQPRLALCQAIAFDLDGRHDKAQLEARRGLERAAALDMQFERQKLEHELEARK